MGLASGGIFGSAARLDTEALAWPDADVAGWLAVAAPSVLPGAIEETSAAMPALRAAAPAIIHRRVRRVRAIAASRSSAAMDGLRCITAVRETAYGKSKMRIM